MRRRPHHQARLWVLLVVVALLMTTLVGRLGQLTVLQHEQYVAQVLPPQTRVVLDQATRGRILDRDGVPLVANAPVVRVTVERAALQAQADRGRDLVSRVADVLDLPREALWSRTFACGEPDAPAAPACFDGSPYEPVVLADGVRPATAVRLSERPESFPGVTVTTRPERSYPHPDGVNAAHLVGYVGRATVDQVAAEPDLVTATSLTGRAGLEATYDDVLRGTPGRTTVEVDGRGDVGAVVSRIPATAGFDLVTHLSAPVQAAAERGLRLSMDIGHRTGKKTDAAAAVVLDVRSGAVVAAASYPTYAPEVWTGGISRDDLAALNAAGARTPLVNRVTAGVFPPASTFKVVSTTAAVRGGADPDGRYGCPPSLRIGGRVFKNNRTDDLGPISLPDALLYSCDTVYYRFAQQAWLAQGGLAATGDAADPFVAASRDFGLGRATGVDLPGEVAGVVPAREQRRELWERTKADTCAAAATGYPDVADPAQRRYLTTVARESCAGGYEFRVGDEVNMSIGQGDLAVTPLQLAGVYAAVANGGTLWTPQVAASLRDAEGRTVRTFEPHRSGDVGLDADTLRVVRAGLRSVVTVGSVRTLFADFPADYPLAGKTGTGEVAGKDPTALFASYGPTTSPRYAVVVVVSQGGAGGAAAAPAVREIWDVLRTLP